MLINLTPESDTLEGSDKVILIIHFSLGERERGTNVVYVSANPLKRINLAVFFRVVIL